MTDRQWNRLPAKLLVCSPEVPPLHTGHAAVLERMFRAIDPGDYCLATFQTRTDEIAGHSGLAARVHRLKTPWGQGRRDGYPLWPVRAARNFATEAARRAIVLARLMRDEASAAILVTSSNTPDLPAALLAARARRVPLIIYMLDNWRHLMAAQDESLGPIASKLQGVIVAGARAVIAPNPFLAADLEREHGRRVTVIGIPLPDAVDVADPDYLPWPHVPGEIRVVFTGQVYDAHFDAIRRLLAALEDPRMAHVALHVYTSQRVEELAAHGIAGRLQVHGHVPPEQVREIQRRADILFLPLGFVSPYPDIVRAAAPTKTGEYLASGRPILVHAPADSYPATMARKLGFAAVVDRPDTEAVVEAIVRIADDPAFRTRIVAAAAAAVEPLYSPRVTSGRFLATLTKVLARA